MISSIISLHTYLMLNCAIALSYFINKAILNSPYFRRSISQKHRLKLARHSFLIGIILIFAMPILPDYLSPTYHSNFQLEPLLRIASINLSEHHKIIPYQTSQINFTPTLVSPNRLLILFLLIGIGVSFIKYIKNVYDLKQIQQHSYYLHKLNNIHVLINSTITIPQCWSLLNHHFIAIPHAYLENKSDLTLAISHEIQHIRQGDTYWLHFMTIIKSICFWNPLIKRWIHWFNELQEFSCDESLMLYKKNLSPTVYAECLMDAASQTINQRLTHIALGIHGFSRSVLYRRIDMLFSYSNRKTKKTCLIFIYTISLFSAISVCYALNTSSLKSKSLSKQEVATLIKRSHLDKSFQVTATTEVVDEINNILNSSQARAFTRKSLQRMKYYQPIIAEALKKQKMPDDLKVVPLVQTGYQPLEQSKNRFLAAGIWQIIPETANKLGLAITQNRDDRLNTALSTKAALTYLSATYSQFHNWKLAYIAYEIGEDTTENLIKKTHSCDAWILACSPFAPDSLKHSIARFDAMLVFMHNPSLINE